MTDHSHESALRAGSRYKRRLTWVFGLVVVFMVAEIVAGILTNSLALLSDAGHMATDALGLGMALAAIVAADRAGTKGRRTFGLYRLEILAALANAVLLFGVAVYVLYEAVQRLQEPPEILSGPMLVVAVLGLIGNVIGWWLLREGADESINVEGAYLEVLADLIGSVGVIAAALIVLFTGWPYADPLFGAAIGLFILPRAWRLGRRAIRVLVQAAPEGIDLDEIRKRLTQIEGVTDVHDLHVWTLTSEMEVASVHLMTPTDADTHAIIDRATSLLKDEIRHRTRHPSGRTGDPPAMRRDLMVTTRVMLTGFYASSSSRLLRRAAAHSGMAMAIPAAATEARNTMEPRSMITVGNNPTLSCLNHGMVTDRAQLA